MAINRKLILDSGYEHLKQGGAVLWVTLTQPVRSQQNLSYRYKQLLAAAVRFRRMIKPIETKKGITHSVRVLEEAFSEMKGWNPHFHLAWFLPAGLSDADAKEFEQQVQNAWIKACQQVGIRGVMPSGQYFEVIQSPKRFKQITVYMTSHGYYPEKPPSPTSRGLMKGLSAFQVLELARTGETRWVKVWQEFELAAKGKHRVVFYKPREKKN
jgi:hypothetical protein